MDEIPQFDKAKPPPFAIRMDVRPKKEYEAADSFGDELNTILNDVDPDVAAARALKTGANSTQFEKDLGQAYTTSQQLTSLTIAKELSGMNGILKFLSNAQKLNIELTNSTDNLERIHDERYVTKESLTERLSKSKLAFEVSAAEQKRKEKKIESDKEISDAIEAVEGRDVTYLHNLSMYQRLDERNPVKEGATEDYNAIKNNAALAPLSKQFVSTLQVLKEQDPKLWDKMNAALRKITDKNAALNIKDVTDPYFDGKAESNSIYMDYHDIVTNPTVYSRMNNEEIFFTMLSAYEDLSRFNSAFANVYGHGPKPTDKPSTTEEEAKKAMAHAEKWWETVGSQVKDVPVLLAQALVPDIANSITRVTNWSKLDESSSTSKSIVKNFGDPRARMIDGFQKYIKEKYMGSYESNRKIEMSDLNIDNQSEANQIWTRLIQRGYVTQDGQVTDRISIEEAGFKLQLNVDAQKEADVQKLLREKYLGSFSFETQDVATKDAPNRRNIKVYNPTTQQYESLDGLISKLNEGETWKEKAANIRASYDSLVRIYSEITGLSKGVPNNGKVQTIKQADGSVSLPIGSNVKWQEWDPKAYQDPVTQKWTGEWKTVQGKSLGINFNSDKDAQKFTDKILGLTQLLVPIVGLFNRDNMTLISNNAMSKDTVKVLDASNTKYKYMLTTFTDYNDDIFADAQKFIKNKSAVAIGTDVFTKVQINHLFQSMHERQKNEWEDEKEVFEDEQIEELKKSKQLEQDIKDDDEMLIMRLEKERKEREMEDKEQAERSQAESKKASNQAAQQDDEEEES